MESNLIPSSVESKNERAKRSYVIDPVFISRACLSFTFSAFAELEKSERSLSTPEIDFDHGKVPVPSRSARSGKYKWCYCDECDN